MIIVAGGTGTRMGSEIPKQFLLLEGLPVLMHSINAFHAAVPDASITITLPAREFERWSTLMKAFSFEVDHTVVEGGETRFHSVKNALSVLGWDGLVAIHDGARPLISIDLILRCFDEAGKMGNAIPAIPVNESMRTSDGTGNRPVDRSLYRLIQTPQVFRLAEIKEAYRQDHRDTFTDDATVLESAGHRIHLTEGDPRNMKITGPDDLLIAHALISRPFHR